MANADSMIETLLDRLPNRDPSAIEGVLRALGWGLVTEGQLFLEATSNEYDVELFFETCGYPQREEPDAWVRRVASELQRQTTIEDWIDLAARAVERAARELSGTMK
jgi:hypothetical protein